MKPLGHLELWLVTGNQETYEPAFPGRWSRSLTALIDELTV
jgi:hypothetical protein